MALSAHEQAMLDEIERGLTATEQKLEEISQQARTRLTGLRSVLVGIAGSAIGLALVLIGLVSNAVIVSVAGFLLILSAIVMIRPTGPRANGISTTPM